MNCDDSLLMHDDDDDDDDDDVDDDDDDDDGVHHSTLHHKQCGCSDHPSTGCLKLKRLSNLASQTAWKFIIYCTYTYIYIMGI